MKIIATSNFDHETQSDRLVAENVKSEYEAKVIVNALNDESGEFSRDFFKAVADDHVLYVWEP